MSQVIVFDLDDTLYHEIDFLKSAYRHIAATLAPGHDPQLVYHAMMAAYQRGENAFEHFITRFSPRESIPHLLSVYRGHHPSITLDPDTEHTLRQLSASATLAIITDGRSVTQRNKISALLLGRFFRSDDILISEETGHNKPSVEPFRLLMRRYPDSSYCYVADNTEKDFIAPNQLGWNTICLRDDGQNIHPQRFDLPAHCLPRHVVATLSQILPLL